jgi:hypothetical protein
MAEDATTEVITKVELDKAKEHLGHAKLLWFIHKVQSYGFWAIILVGAGVALGLWCADRENVKNINAQILVGSFLHKGTVYDVSPRAIQPAPLPTDAAKATADAVAATTAKPVSTKK